MAKPLLDEAGLVRYSARFDKLSESTDHLWGVMNSTEMVRHLRQTIQMSLEEVKVTDRSNFLTRTFIKWIFFNSMSKWPKGLPNGKKEEWHPQPEGDFASERDLLIATMRRFCEMAIANPKRVTVSEGFGPNTMKYWRLIHGRHIEHHLRQFGV